jgi:radical S-adenosyl methionine domain-containing protein 2
MAKSYLILDEYMRFLDRDGRAPSSSILDVDVSVALAQVYWDQDSFLKRGGIYDWGRELTTRGGCGISGDKKLEW